MSRLQTERDRLYRDPEGPPDRARAFVLEVAQPADWAMAGRVWTGVQDALGLPAPGLAVSGRDAYQLWFATREPVPRAEARAWLEALCRRFVPGLPPHRLRLRVGSGEAGGLPPAAVEPGRWSAFVSADLAPLFADTPWLDLPPGDDNQAQLLAGLQPIGPEAWAGAWSRLREAGADGSPEPAAGPTAPPAPAAPPASPSLAGPWDDPRRFLLAVVNDAAAPLDLRIEAARALLGAPPAR